MDQIDQYTPHQQHAFLEAFNSAYEEYDGDESRAFATAHATAHRTPEREPAGSSPDGSREGVGNRTEEPSRR
jgi:cation transport regulator